MQRETGELQLLRLKAHPCLRLTVAGLVLSLAYAIDPQIDAFGVGGDGGSDAFEVATAGGCIAALGYACTNDDALGQGRISHHQGGTFEAEVERQVGSLETQGRQGGPAGLAARKDEHRILGCKLGGHRRVLPRDDRTR